MVRNPLKKMFQAWVCPGGGCDCAASEPVRVAAVKDIAADKSYCAAIGGRKISIVRSGDRFFALDNACTHLGGPLCKGVVKDGIVVCPWHGSEFKAETGEAISGPAKKAVSTVELEVRGDDLYAPPQNSRPAVKPQAIALVFHPEFDRERPFRYEPFVKEVVEGLKFPFKLHGVLSAMLIAQDDDELDFDLGGIHATEVDLKKMTALMDALNAKWGTSVTYCLYHSSQFPGDMLLNVRGFQATSTVANDIKF
ncbi:MAG: Rieske (2Fe-2S) protein [Patescibacteria group bacterium]|jgi:3-phenylpropionate/trans-cinnamate dioxygenase ferredoxin subunit